MGKRHVKQESILKEAKRLWMHVSKNLKEDDEELVDLTWRPVGTKLGPPGWSYVLTCKNASGKNPHQGFSFGPEPPSIKNIETSVEIVREKMESSIVRDKIIVPPQGKIIT